VKPSQQIILSYWKDIIQSVMMFYFSAGKPIFI